MQSWLKCVFGLGLKIKIISLFNLFLLLFMGLVGARGPKKGLLGCSVGFGASHARGGETKKQKVFRSFRWE